MVGAKWLRHGGEAGGWNATEAGEKGWKQGETFPPQYPDAGMMGEKSGTQSHQKVDKGANGGNLNQNDIIELSDKSNPVKPGISVLENKKRRTGDGPIYEDGLGKNTELNMDSDEENTQNMEQDTCMDPKNVKGAGSGPGARLAL
ncbi:hypothetical protein POM88_030391 [Heracleum sosnowskyi]|uniref:Uncharacterized protein n=1 Tax=Heracleum sosnowskyi TaxID=360622 RepID=A0AAD8HWD4_9APIA|nr:hypothetical protein POM88_030391 [Heracleum sosnowskyi]